MIHSDYKNKKSTTTNNSRTQYSNAKYNNQENNDTVKARENMLLKSKQKNRELEQLGINPDDIIEQEEKRQPFCQEE